MKRSAFLVRVESSRRDKISYVVMLVGVVFVIGLAALMLFECSRTRNEFSHRGPIRGANRASFGSAWYRSSGQWLADVHTLAGMAHYLFEPEPNFRENFARLDNPASSVSTVGETAHTEITNEQTKGWEPATGRAIGTTVL